MTREGASAMHGNIWTANWRWLLHQRRERRKTCELMPVAITFWWWWWWWAIDACRCTIYSASRPNSPSAAGASLLGAVITRPIEATWWGSRRIRWNEGHGATFCTTTITSESFPDWRDSCGENPPQCNESILRRSNDTSERITSMRKVYNLQ